MKNLKNSFVAIISILLVACASFMFIPTMGMIVTFSTDTYFQLVMGACGVLNAVIALICTLGYVAIEFGE
jgi:hypothetical protein